jgi:hypothetical protein
MHKKSSNLWEVSALDFRPIFHVDRMCRDRDELREKANPPAEVAVRSRPQLPSALEV